MLVCGGMRGGTMRLIASLARDAADVHPVAELAQLEPDVAAEGLVRAFARQRDLVALVVHLRDRHHSAAHEVSMHRAVGRGDEPARRCRR